MRHLFFLSVIIFITSCSKEDITKITSMDILTQPGWKPIAILNKDSSMKESHPDLPTIFIRFNKNGIINGNFDGKFILLNETTIKYSMQLDTIYAPYPVWFYTFQNLVKEEQTATLLFHSYSSFEIINEKNRIVFERY